MFGVLQIPPVEVLWDIQKDDRQAAYLCGTGAQVLR